MAETTLSICRGNNSRYLARSRNKGFQSWRVISKHRTYRAAIAAAGRAFTDRALYRADVILVADYYPPVQLMEMVRR